MATTVMIDGLLVPPERAVVSVFDRGFLYGDSVFETIRVYASRLYGSELLPSRLSAVSIGQREKENISEAAG